MTPMTKMAVGLLPVAEVDRALAGAERRRQRAAARLVAHVRAVRQVVRAELARPELVEERRLVAEPARTCRTTPGSGSPGRAACEPTSANASSHEIGHVVVASPGRSAIGSVSRPGVLECEVAPVRRARSPCARRRTRAPTLLARHLPRDVLDAVLADVEVQALAVVGPGAAGAVEAARPRGSS